MDDPLQVSEWIMVFLVWREFWNGKMWCEHFVIILFAFHVMFMCVIKRLASMLGVWCMFHNFKLSTLFKWFVHIWWYVQGRKPTETKPLILQLPFWQRKEKNINNRDTSILVVRTSFYILISILFPFICYIFCVYMYTVIVISGQGQVC